MEYPNIRLKSTHICVSVSVCVQGVRQGHVYHEALLIIIILNGFLLPFDA